MIIFSVILYLYFDPCNCESVARNCIKRDPCSDSLNRHGYFQMVIKKSVVNITENDVRVLLLYFF